MLAQLDKVVKAAMANESAMARLRELCDTFGHRLSGSLALEQSIEWARATMERDGLANVHLEPAMVPSWKRGEERAEAVLGPNLRTHPMQILGIGLSVGTGPEGIDAEVVCVRDFDEMEARAGECAGRVVLFNAPYTTYGESVQYRLHGHARAAKHGALAVLVRSVTPVSLYTPHTGTLREDASAQDRPIPAACVTVEDAELLQRWCDQKQPVRVRLFMGCTRGPDVLSHNVVGEFRGREIPEEVVVLGGHIDSWDVGTGAHDDGQGCIVSWEVLRVLQQLGIRPRRTVRVVLWTNEEMGGSGAQAYADQHAGERDRTVAAVETDLGVGRPVGFGFSGPDISRGWLAELIAPLAANQVTEGGRGVDIVPLIDQGVPGLLLRHEDSWRLREYFHLHHTHADTIDKIDPVLLRENLAAMAGVVFLLAEWEGRL